jgi:mannose-6-phosphate isomerase
MGAHPVAPSLVERNGGRISLETVVREQPERELGEAATRAFGPRLPFLLKILAAAEPLSLQAHPNAEQARAGWENEERLGVDVRAPHRNYKDAFHKPELLCALTPFDALSGFREIPETLRLFDALNVPELDVALAPLRARPDPSGLAEAFRRLMTSPPEEQQTFVEATRAACARTTAFPRERALVVRLAELYPGDVGVVSALLLQFVRLEPGQAIYLNAGNLHAYVEGTGIEIMASSDNVLRGGLTKKHVDVPELLRVLDFGGGPARVLSPRPIDAFESVYETNAREFRLSRIVVNGAVPREVRGPEILLVTEGSVRADAIEIPRGGSLFVPAAKSRYSLSGNGTVYRATTNV